MGSGNNSESPQVCMGVAKAAEKPPGLKTADHDLKLLNCTFSSR